MEGNQIVLLLLKLLSQLANKISKLIEKAAIGYLRHRQRKRELGLKKGKVFKADKVELLIAKNLKKTLSNKEKTFEEKVRVSNFKLDCYKLEMQSELAEFEKNIKILKNGLDTAKEQINKEMYQKELNKAIREKTDFEKEVNRTLLDKNKEIKKLESEYKHIKENIKICDKAIDGFASNIAKDMTESIRSNFETLVKEESISQSKEKQELKRQQDQELKTQQKQELKTQQEQDPQKQKEDNYFTLKTQFEKEVVREVFTEIETGAEKEIEKEFDKQINKNVSLEHESSPAKTSKDLTNTNKTLNKDDEFMKEYLEKQRRRSLTKEKQKNLDIGR